MGFSLSLSALVLPQKIAFLGGMAIESCGTQGRNEGRQGGHNSPGTKSLWGATKSPNNVLRFEHGGAKLVSCPGRL